MCVFRWDQSSSSTELLLHTLTQLPWWRRHVDRMCKREIERILVFFLIFCHNFMFSSLFCSSFLPSRFPIQQHPFTPSKSVSLSSPSAPSACRRDEVMHHRRSAEPPRPHTHTQTHTRCALPVPATQSQAYGCIIVPAPLPEHLTPSSHAWRAVCAHTRIHTSRQDGHTYAHTETHTTNLAWRAYPWLPHCEPHHQLWIIRTVKTPVTVARTVLTVTVVDGVTPRVTQLHR